ncbi:hypothetical protein [Photobacterium sanguinicancri]|uniref:hypothetical protein n=1 Tax=Photobacterium sanguinicancri TaxID=875932 RepID=UPI0026E23D34|nr:hypothetical protein [Photobacterium sanguinicancri]MDO6497344.1 hypothetical protein [Photobacterium sanguinicancri]
MGAGNHQSLATGIPELRNPRYRDIYNLGRERRLKGELANQSVKPPLFSHNPTYQILFQKGWQSVSPQDVRLASTAGLSGEKARARIYQALGVPH